MEIERKFLIKKLPDNLTSYKARKLSRHIFAPTLLSGCAAIMMTTT